MRKRETEVELDTGAGSQSKRLLSPYWSLQKWLSSLSRFCWVVGYSCRRTPQTNGRGWKTWGGSHGSSRWLWTNTWDKVSVLVHLSNIAPQSTWGKLIYQVKHQYPYHMTKQCPIFRLICTGVSRELLTLRLGLWAWTFKEAHVSVFLASFSPHVDCSCTDTSDMAGNEWCYLTTHLSERASWQSRRLFSSMRSMRLALRTPTHLKWMWTVG